MKKTLYQIGMLAIAALAFASCAKEVEGNKPEKAYTHYATVTLGKAGETKTAVTEGQNSASYVWTTGDEEYLHVFENGTEGEITNIAYSQDMKTATLTVAFTGTPTAPYEYTARYFKEESGSHNPLIQEVQFPKADNFDPAADIMISKEITSEDERLGELEFTMGRVVTVNKMTLTGLAEGEEVSKVEITFNKNVVAYYVLDTGNYSGHGSKLTLKYENSPITVPASGEVPVYFISAPVEDAAFKSVVVTTDVNVYTKSDQLDPNPFEGKNGITFAIGTMKRFKMAMAGYGEAIPEAVKYYKVTDPDQIADGAEYLIVANVSGQLFAMGDYVDANKPYYAKVDVTETVDAVNGNYIEITSEAVIPVTLEFAGEDKYYIVDSEDNYLYYTGGDNTVSRGEKDDNNINKYKWTVSWWSSTSEGIYETITNVGTDSRKLKYNASSPRFACYTSAQTNIILYYKEGSVVELEDPSLVFSLNGDAVDEENPVYVNWDERDSFVEPELNVPEGASVFYSSINDAVATVDETTGEITFVGNGETIIYANTTKTETFKAAEASYKLIVSGKPDELENGWVETALSEIGPGDVFVIVGNGAYAISSSGGTSNNPPAVGVTVSNNMLTGDIDDAIKWNVSGDATEGYTFYPDGLATMLFCNTNATSSSNTNLRVGNGGTYNRTKFRYTEEEQLVTNDEYTPRYIGINGSTDFRGYVAASTNSVTFKFYKYTVNDGMSAAEVTLGYTGTVTVGDAPVQLTLTKDPSDLEVTLTSSNPDVATVTNAAVATIAGAGTTTITAAWDEQTIDGTTYRAGSVDYTLTVNKMAVTVSFPDPVTTVAVGATVQNAAMVTPTGLTITYSSSNTNVATVDNSGVVTGVANGIATITASFDGNANYEAASDNYSITVGEGANDGSSAHPFTVAEAIAAIPASGTLTDKYVSGIVTVTQDHAITYNSSYHSLTYWITDDGDPASEALEVYSGKGINGADFTSANDLGHGDAVVVKGDLKKYGEVYEFNYNNELVSLVKAPYFTASVTSNSIAYTGGNSIVLQIKANVPWNASIDNGGTLKIGDNNAAITISGNSDTDVTVIIPENEDGETYTISFTTTSGDVTAPEDIEIIQSAKSTGGTPLTSTLTFEAKCNGSGTADDGAEWTVTSDGTESNFDNNKGIHYGTNSAQVQYIKLSTSDIPGTITSVVVNACTASGVTATVDVTVGGSAFGGNAQTLSTSATDYTFTGSASGEIIVTVTKPSKASKALYVKSVAVTYTN